MPNDFDINSQGPTFIPLQDPTTATGDAKVSQQENITKLGTQDTVANYTVATNTKVSGSNVSTSPSGPILTLPNHVNAPNDTIVKLNNNPYFSGVNFTAILSSIMNAINELNTKNQYIGAQTQIKLVNSEVSTGLAQAADDVTLGNLNSQEMMNQAMNSLANAVIAGVQIGSMVGNLGKANREAQEEQTKLETKVVNLTPPRVQDQAQMGPDTEELTTAKNNLNTFVNGTGPGSKSAFVMHHQQMYDQQTQLMGKMLESGNNAIMQMQNAAIESQKGIVQADKQINQTYEQQYKSYNQEISANVKQSQDLVSSAMQLLMKITDDRIQFKGLHF